MADEINFSGKLAKKVDISEVKPDGVQTDRKDKVASLFNTQKDGSDASVLTSDELVVLNSIDENHDGKITEDEIKKYYNANFKDNSTKNPNQVTEAEYISYVKAMAKANQEALEADSTNVGNAYTVQLGENLDDLATRVAKSIMTNPSAEDIEDIKQQIIKLNKDNGAIKFSDAEKTKVKWLVGGQQLILPTDTTSARAKKNVKNQDNKAQVESKYKAWRGGRGPLKSFTYKIDDDGKTYEVRSGGETEFDASKMYKADGKYEGVSVETEDVLNYDAIQYEDGKEQEVKAKIKAAVDAVNSLTDKNNIDGTPTRDGNKVTIKLKDGGKVVVNYGDTNDRNKITDIYYYPKDATSPSVTFEHTNKLYAAGIKGGVQKGGVKNWSALTEIVSDAIDNTRPDGADIVDLKDADYGNFASKKAAVDARIKQGTDVLDKLKDKDNIESIGDVRYARESNYYFVTVKLKSGEEVNIRMKPDGSLIGAAINFDGESYQEIGFFYGSINLTMTDNKSGWDIEGLGKVDMDKLKALIPKEAMDKLNAAINKTENFSDEEKKKPIVLRVVYYASNKYTSRSGWVRVLTPDGKMYNANMSASAFSSAEEMIDKGCANLKEQLRKAGWTNVILVNPNAGDDSTNVSKTAPQNTNIDKNKAYQIYVPWDQNAKVARVTLPDGQEMMFSNVTTNPSQTEDIKKWIQDQGFVNARIRDNM